MLKLQLQNFILHARKRGASVTIINIMASQYERTFGPVPPELMRTVYSGRRGVGCRPTVEDFWERYRNDIQTFINFEGFSPYVDPNFEFRMNIQRCHSSWGIQGDPEIFTEEQITDIGLRRIVANLWRNFNVNPREFYVYTLNITPVPQPPIPVQQPSDDQQDQTADFQVEDQVCQPSGQWKEIPILPHPNLIPHPETGTFSEVSAAQDWIQDYSVTWRASNFYDRFVSLVLKHVQRFGSRKVRVYFLDADGAPTAMLGDELESTPTMTSATVRAERFRDDVQSAIASEQNVSKVKIVIRPGAPYTFAYSRSWRGKQLTINVNNCYKAPVGEMMSDINQESSTMWSNLAISIRTNMPLPFKMHCLLWVMVSRPDGCFMCVYLGQRWTGDPIDVVNAALVPLSIQTLKQRIRNAIQEFQLSGSGFNVEYIRMIHIGLSATNPGEHVGSSYLPTPSDIMQRLGSTINVKNYNNNKCAVYSLMASQYVLLDTYSKEIDELNSKIKDHCDDAEKQRLTEVVRQLKLKRKKSIEFQRRQRETQQYYDDFQWDMEKFYTCHKENWNKMKDVYGEEYEVPEPFHMDISMFLKGEDEGVHPLDRVWSDFERINNVSLFIYELRPGKTSIRKNGRNVTRAGTNVVPLRKGRVITDELNGVARLCARIIRLIFIQSRSCTVGHFITISNMSALMHCQLTTGRNGRVYVCDVCLRPKGTKELLEKHLMNGCPLFNDAPARCPLPARGIMKFRRLYDKEPAPFLIYMDSESILTTKEDHYDSVDTLNGDAQVTDMFTSVDHAEQAVNSIILQKHIPICFALLLSSKYFPSERVYFVYDEDPSALMRKVCGVLEIYHSKINQLLTNVSMMYQMEDTSMITLQSTCAVCGEHLNPGEAPLPYYHPLTGGKIGPVHIACGGLVDPELKCHVCGGNFSALQRGYADWSPFQFRELFGAAHKECITKRPLPGKTSNIPIGMHNFSGYDGHAIVKYSSQFSSKFEILAQNTERMITMTMTRLKMTFDDTLKKIMCSLDTAVSRMVESVKASLTDGDQSTLIRKLREKFVHVSREFPSEQDDGDEKFMVCMHKGYFPYSYIDHPSKLYQTDFPSPEDFQDILTGRKSLEAAKYDEALKTFHLMRCKNMKDYMKFYVKLDVLLLADVMAEHASIGLSKTPPIDPRRFLSAPSAAWNDMLLTTGVELELMKDTDMHVFVERAIRGGITVVNQRFSEANDKRLEGMIDENSSLPMYDPAQPESSIWYRDCNGLYSTVMYYFPLPEKDFAWHDIGTMPRETFLRCMNLDCTVGYFLEVDIEIPQELHELLDDYPPCVQNLTITEEMLSPWQKENKPADWKPFKKLVGNLFPKYKYVIHSILLEEVMRLGCKVTALYKILRFSQRRWIQSYVHGCLDRRAKSSNEWEKAYWKLMVNAVFGKSLENVRRSQVIKLVLDEEDRKKLVNDPHYRGFIDVGENVSLFSMMKKSVVLDKPVAVGASILDLSKWWMMRMWYYMKTKLTNHGMDANINLKLLYTDTDCFIMKVLSKEARELLENMSAAEIYPEFFGEQDGSIWGKGPGRFKDEMDGHAIQAFVGICPKQYNIVAPTFKKSTDEGEQVNPFIKAKGIDKRVAACIDPTDYERCVKMGKEMSVEVYRISSTRHDVFTLAQKKRAFRNWDGGKRWINDDGLSSVCFGHKSTWTAVRRTLKRFSEMEEQEEVSHAKTSLEQQVASYNRIMDTTIFEEQVADMAIDSLMLMHLGGDTSNSAFSLHERVEIDSYVMNGVPSLY